MILPKARKRNTRPEEDALHEVVMHLRLRAIRGLWTGFDCSEFESVCGDAVLVELARGENNYILVADKVVAFQARHKIVDFFVEESSDVAFSRAYAISNHLTVYSYMATKMPWPRICTTPHHNHVFVWLSWWW